MILDKNARLFNIVDFDCFGVNPTENSLISENLFSVNVTTLLLRTEKSQYINFFCVHLQRLEKLN